MTQFKDKSGKNTERVGLGLYSYPVSYPVLMAAGILLYNAARVPVGDDRRQYLELTRDIDAAFNRDFKTDLFKIPGALIPGDATRIMSLRGGKIKMSKSDASELSRIHLTNTADLIREKFRKAKTAVGLIGF